MYKAGQKLVRKDCGWEGEVVSVTNRAMKDCGLQIHVDVQWDTHNKWDRGFRTYTKRELDQIVGMVDEKQNDFKTFGRSCYHAGTELRHRSREGLTGVVCNSYGPFDRMKVVKWNDDDLLSCLYLEEDMHLIAEVVHENED